MPSETEPTFSTYHVLMDTLITSLYERLAGATSKRVADQFMMTTATRVAEKLVGDSPDPVEAMRAILLANSCQVDKARTDDSTNWTVICPFAQSVHLKIPSDTICPLALLFLGAVQLRERESELTAHSLNAGGSKFTIKHKS